MIDANNYYPGRDGQIPELDAGEIDSSELLAHQLPGARIVKAFNTIYFERIAHEGRPSGSKERIAVPIAGDDPDAKQVVGALIDDMGFDPVDAGSLADGRRQEPRTRVYNVPLGANALRTALAET